MRPSAEGGVGPLAVQLVGGENERLAHREPLGDVTREGIAMRDDRIAVRRRLLQVAPIEANAPASDLDEHRLAVDALDRAPVAVGDAEAAVVAANQHDVARSEALPAYRQLRTTDDADVEERLAGEAVQLPNVG